MNVVLVIDAVQNLGVNFRKSAVGMFFQRPPALRKEPMHKHVRHLWVWFAYKLPVHQFVQALPIRSEQNGP